MQDPETPQFRFETEVTTAYFLLQISSADLL